MWKRLRERLSDIAMWNTLVTIGIYVLVIWTMIKGPPSSIRQSAAITIVFGTMVQLGYQRAIGRLQRVMITIVMGIGYYVLPRL
jgi:hypothetical protein